MSELEIMFAHIDQMDETGNHVEAYELLLKEVNDELDPELLWRMARVCYQLAYPMEHKNPKKKQLLDEGHNYATSAYNLKSDDLNVLRWYAALTGSRTDFLGTKEKIEQGNLFKDVLDKALEINPEEYTLLHMRGRFAFSVASLSWLERKAANTLFGPVPEITYDDAIRDFLAVVELLPDWLDNLLFLAKSLLAKGEKAKAVEYLKKAVDSNQQDENKEEPDLLKEAKVLLKKHSK